MQFKTWHAIDPPPTLAEDKLKTAAEAGVPCILGPDDEIPEDLPDWSTAPPNRLIRAEVLRVILLGLDGCATTEKGVLLGGAYVSGSLDLTDCTIRGKLVLHGCRFEQKIFAPRSNWTNSLRLKTCALPALRAAGAKIGGQLSCQGATFNTPKGISLHLQGAEITGGLYLRHGTRIAGLLALNNAHTTTLVDDGKCWPRAGKLILDGFTYDRIIGPLDIKTRLDWLARGDRWNGTFYPQPYKQLAKVLHDTGHEAQAQEILFTLATKLAAERQMEIRKQIEAARPFVPNLGLAIGLRVRLGAEIVADTLLRIVVGYGRKPFRSIGWLVILIALCWVFAHGAWHRGDFAPNSAVILQSAEWRSLTDHPNAAQHWAKTSPTGRYWESFHPLAYAADVVIPIVDLGQTEAWAPSTERGPWGAQLWYWRWFFIALGWIVTALGAAALTGIIRRE